MLSAPSKWYRTQPTDVKTEKEELLVFGYSCKIFRDDEKATYIDQGKHLIPWMGDETLMIDRYDVRGYLHDLAPYEANPKRDTEEDTEEERLCDEERYLALNTDLTEEELYHEEELKRLRAAVASDGAYHEIGFSYDSIEDSNEKNEPANVKEEPEDEPYLPPDGLKVPKGMHTPSNMKIHTIIEKTALFISQQGGQMEIIIKMKQSNNPQFAFMQFDNPLYPYYRHLLQEIKAGHYKPVVEKKVSESDDEHHDDHYLHPSLSGAAESVPKFTVPSINFRRTGDDSYSLLVKNLKDRIEYDQQRNSPTVQIESNVSPASDGIESAKSTQLNQDVPQAKEESPASSSDSDLSSSESEDSDEIIPPPPDVKPVIDKMAEYVAKNGSDFETIVKSKNDKRFEFLNPGHKFYNYYKFRRNFLTEKISASASTVQSKEKELSQPVPGQPVSAAQPCAAEIREESQTDSSLICDESITKSQPVTSAASSEPSSQPICEPDTTVNAKPKDTQALPKPKTPVKIVKGPICFSLKPKEPEAPLLEKPKAPAVLMEDSDEEGDEDGVENKTAQVKTTIAEKLQPVVSTASVIQPTHTKVPAVSVENEEKRKLSSEEIEAKLAEERMKDKLAAAVRERLTQQKRDKQLQLERKQRAAMFLKMLQKKKSGDAAVAGDIGEPESPVIVDEGSKATPGTPEMKNGSCASPSLSEKNSPRDIPSSSVAQPSPSASLQEGEMWSSSSDSEELANVDDLEEAPVNDQAQEVSSSQEPITETKKRKMSPENKPKPHSKSHRSSSKKHKRSRSRSPSHKHKKSSSKSKSHKEKKLPAAYAVIRRSRSKSRSPVRYGGIRGRSRSPPHVFNRWR